MYGEKITASVKNGRRLFVFANSFVLSLAPFLAERYEEITLGARVILTKNHIVFCTKAKRGKCCLFTAPKAF